MVNSVTVATANLMLCSGKTKKINFEIFSPMPFFRVDGHICIRSIYTAKTVSYLSKNE